jgi:hypothetical protein
VSRTGKVDVFVHVIDNERDQGVMHRLKIDAVPTVMVILRLELSKCGDIRRVSRDSTNIRIANVLVDPALHVPLWWKRRTTAFANQKLDHGNVVAVDGNVQCCNWVMRVEGDGRNVLQ